MENDKLTQKEEALLAQARREAAARKESPAAAAQSTPAPQPTPQPPSSLADRLALLMEAERAETQERKRRMRRNGLLISGGILGVFVLWLLSSFRGRRR